MGKHDHIRWDRLGLIAWWVVIATFLVIDVRIVFALTVEQPPGMDFLTLWAGAGADPSRVYDFAHVTELQSWLYQGRTRPFVYPPSALLFLRPLAQIDYWAALVAFVAGSAALFFWAGHRLGADWRLFIAPPVVYAAAAGQVSLLIGGLVMVAVTVKRPIISGVLYGIAGAIKPQMLVLLPIALLAERNWRTFAATTGTAVLLFLLSLNSASWMQWLEALPRFTALVAADPRLTGDAISPYAWFGWIGLVVALPVSVVAVWWAFRTDSAPHRVLALLGGALAVSPYAMDYELAMLVAPALAIGGALLLPVLVLFAAAILIPGVLVLGAALAMLTTRPKSLAPG